MNGVIMILFGVFEYGMTQRNHSKFQSQFERRIFVEEEVRTHMIAGHYAADLVRDEKELIIDHMKNTGYKVDEEKRRLIEIENN